jgi:hypothetical protein
MTDPNEITQAAARLEANRYSHAPVGMVQWTKDVTLLAKYGYERFAAVPADDGEPVTPEWLLSVGFTIDHEMEPPRDPVYCIRSLLWRPHYFGVNQGTWQFGPVTIDQNPKTRGDVRRLCAALGIPLPDQPKGGA